MNTPSTTASETAPLPLTEAQIEQDILQLGKQAKAAALQLALLSSDDKNKILLAMAAGIRAASDDILAANALDIAAGEAKGLSSAMLDRLRLDTNRLEGIASGVEQVANLPDPTNEIMDEWDRPNGIHIQQLRVPIGVIGIIYESRPNVTSDAAVLCFKSGNATILRGGSEAIHSNKALAKALQAGGEQAGLPKAAIQLIENTDRASVKYMAQMDQYLDLIIPRGGKGLIETVVSLARMPVIKHYDGICHLYVDAAADIDMAVNITVDAKTQKPSVCNALETLLVDESVAPIFLPLVEKALKAKGVELRADAASQTYLAAGTTTATEEDWQTEYLELILAVKTVANIDEAIDHINTYSSKHSDCIITQDEAQVQRFMTEIDAACLFHNVSTRFSDGEEFGFGAEIGISTDKLHARGPMGLKELTSYQYRVTGTGQTKS